MSNLEARRLGLRTIVAENAGTWTMHADDEEARQDKICGFLWFYGVPLLASVPFWGWWDWHVHLQNLGQIFAGVAVFTGLLFGLLALMFNTAITLRKDGQALANAHDLRRLVGDLRANITYAAFVDIVLALILVLAASITPPGKETAWEFTPIVVGLFLHLALTLLVILRRFRTAFNYISR